MNNLTSNSKESWHYKATNLTHKDEESLFSSLSASVFPNFPFHDLELRNLGVANDWKQSHLS